MRCERLVFCAGILPLLSISIISAQENRVPQRPPLTQAEAGVAGKVTELLQDLKEEQDQGRSGKDAWAGILRQLIELGPDATPTLIRSLEQTPYEDRRMLRSIPFVMRGIGDKRAVPALIATLPRCFGSDGSDMGYGTNDNELLAFMRKHDNDSEDRNPDGYKWGRPINEVRTALIRLTGTDHRTSELCHVSVRSSTPRQRHLKEVLFHSCAARWAAWWEANWRDHVSDAAYSKVRLPALESEGDFRELDREATLVLASARSNLICQSAFEEGTGPRSSERTFHDLDTGRSGGVHKRWRNSVTTENVAIVSKWAASQAFDLMGSEVQAEGKTVYVLELIAGEAWQIPFENWNGYRKQTAAQLIKSGRKVDRRLTVHRDGKEDLRGTGAFFVITKDGTPLILRLGVEVHDTNVVYGRPTRGDRELNPVHSVKGRRFGLRSLKPEPKE